MRPLNQEPIITPNTIDYSPINVSKSTFSIDDSSTKNRLNMLSICQHYSSHPIFDIFLEVP